MGLAANFFLGQFLVQALFACYFAYRWGVLRGERRAFEALAAKRERLLDRQDPDVCCIQALWDVTEDILRKDGDAKEGAS